VKSTLKRILSYETRVKIRYAVLRKTMKKKGPMPHTTRERLKSIYKEEVEKLEGLIQRDLSAWRA